MIEYKLLIVSSEEAKKYRGIFLKEATIVMTKREKERFEKEIPQIEGLIGRTGNTLIVENPRI